MLQFLRKYKLTYQVFNFFKKNQLKHNLPLYKKYGLAKKYFSAISSEDFKGIESPLNKYDRKDSRTEMPKDILFQSLEEKTQKSLLNWSEDGYVILENFFTEKEVEAFNQEVESLLDSGEVKFRYRNKIMFAMHKSSLLKQAGSNDKILKILEVLMGKKVDLFQSINFLTGSQQRTHSDSIHMTTFPYGNLIAIWVALEDIQPDSGALHYYPRSHKLPYVMNREYDNIGSRHKLGDKTYSDYENKIEEVIQKNQFKKETFLPKKGDVLIWHANLLHGGNKLSNKGSTRKSMVFHYYAQDAICFHEISQRPTLKRD